MTDHLTVNGGGRLQLSATLKWVTGAAASLIAAATMALFATVYGDSVTLARVEERLIGLETRMVSLDARVAAGTRDRYTAAEAARDLAAIDRRFNEIAGRLSVLEQRLYEGGAQ